MVQGELQPPAEEHTQPSPETVAEKFVDHNSARGDQVARFIGELGRLGGQSDNMLCTGRCKDIQLILQRPVFAKFIGTMLPEPEEREMFEAMTGVAVKPPKKPEDET